jgi:hypothetical protein
MGIFDFLKKGKGMATDAVSKVADSTNIDEKVMGMAQDGMAKATDAVQNVASKTDLDEKAMGMVGDAREKVEGMMGSDDNKPQA